MTSAMYFKLVMLFLLVRFTASEDPGFIYNGFRGANVILDGVAEITPNGLLKVTNTSMQQTGHAFYSHPFQFKNSSNGTTFSFSTTFVFAIVPVYPQLSGHGIAFLIAPSRGLPGALPSQYLGLFNETNNGDPTNHIVAIELDTIQNKEFGDINNNHVGLDINDLKSVESAPAGYFTNENGEFKNLSLISGQPMQVWVEYNGKEKQLSVTLAPINIPKPNTPLLLLSRDLSPIIVDSMYAGFSSSTGSILTSHYILGWSFSINGQTQELDLPRLPKLPPRGPREKSRALTIGLPVIAVVATLMMISCIFFIVRRKRKFAEVLEDWELDYGPHRFKYKDLYTATKGFRDKDQLLGVGGFGRVYKGILPISKIEVAIKRVSHESKQGMREFVAEIGSLGRLRHRNLVQLLGYCRRKEELLLVYDFMSHGSLDKFLYDQTKATLNWGQRFGIIKGVAYGLCYLHEGWEQVVVHRDVKASNVLLDGELNGRLGDFGFARLFDHGTDPQTTHVVGTFGYIAPELTRTGMATTNTDVFSFGAFMLEVACGRRPIEPQGSLDELVLVDWVFSCWNRGVILHTIDPNLGSNYSVEEMELVLKLGLLCSHSEPMARPSMRQVVQFLEGDFVLPELSSLGLYSNGTFSHGQSFSDGTKLYPSMEMAPSQPSSAADPLSSEILDLTRLDSVILG
ncbi:hypothetical protein HHK36_016350 [Tetracentron sinense]|uniref:non-specific serine/threonine protein kinase n=1 Tax=Tetracentron sinense TaxID=13715 RepID=A0A834YX37_TETSI|nr:hypothetical protein HHK36_016350 [Tetracentron sinense]